MKKLQRKDKYKRQQFLKNEIKHFILKSVVINKKINSSLKWKAFLELSTNLKINTNSFVNRCLFTNRKKRINKLYSFSRLVFLKFARFGYLNGIKKSGR